MHLNTFMYVYTYRFSEPYSGCQIKKSQRKASKTEVVFSFRQYSGWSLIIYSSF